MSLARKHRDPDEAHIMPAPVDTKIRERLLSAKLREVTFRLREVLSTGGYQPHEVDAIVESVASLLRNGQPVTADRLSSALRAKGFAKANAELVSRELAPT